MTQSVPQTNPFLYTILVVIDKDNKCFDLC